MLAFKIRPTAKHAPQCLTKSALSAPLKEQYRQKRVFSLCSLDAQKFLKNKLKILTKTKNYSIIRQ